MLNWFATQTSAANHRVAPVDMPASGIVAGTRIATEEGWRRAETLCAGDRVMTFDNGVQTLRSVSRRLCPGPSDGASVSQPLIMLSPGTAGNSGTLLMLPGQGLILESDLAERVYGDPFALLPGEAMQALPGVTAMLSEAPIVAVSLTFECDELVYADGQALLYCGSGTLEHPETLEDAVFGEEARYRMLPVADARALTEAIAGEKRAPVARAPLTVS